MKSDLAAETANLIHMPGQCHPWHLGKTTEELASLAKKDEAAIFSMLCLGALCLSSCDC